MLLRVTLYPECIQVALCCLSGLMESAGSWEGKAVTKSKQSLQEGVGGQFNQNTLSWGIEILKHSIFKKRNKKIEWSRKLSDIVLWPLHAPAHSGTHIHICTSLHKDVCIPHIRAHVYNKTGHLKQKRKGSVSYLPTAGIKHCDPKQR